jgi:tetratricopeptide (TPR) repeat protein/predicted Ser/Thr protein kinase
MAPVAECPNADTLDSFVSGRLEPAAAALVRAHLATCSRCYETLLEAGHTLPAEASESAATARYARGAIVGRYVVMDWLGAGGMGVIYAAYDPELHRKVALKLLRTPNSSSFEARLRREAQAIASLSHPNVISVYDVGKHDEHLFIAMELIEGHTLRAWVKTERPRWRQILGAYRQAGQALAAAHALGIVHRDFKPDNALIDSSGRVRVVDFGLARSSLDVREGSTAEPPPPSLAEQTVTRSGSVLGTPGYMAPEQHLGEPAGAAADQFSFCVSLCEALWQERPFAGDTFDELKESVLANRLREPSQKALAPLWIYRVLSRGLRASPDERYHSMAALLAALDRDPARNRRRWLGIAGAIGLAGMAVGLARVHSTSEVCRAAARPMADVWNEERRSALRDAFAATGKQFAGEAFALAASGLDQYTRAWGAMRTDACEATRRRGDQSEEVMELRMECLDRRREEVRALVDVLAHADAQVMGRAKEAVDKLSGLDECRNAEALRQVIRPPASHEAHTRVAALRARIAEASARYKAARYAEGRQIAERAVNDARALEYAPVLAEALEVRGQLEWRLGDLKRSADTLVAAAAAAETGRDDHERALAFIDLVFVVGIRQERYADATGYGLLARAALARAGGDRELEIRVEAYEAGILTYQARYDEALARFERLIPRAERVFGHDAGDLGILLNNQAEAFRKKGDYARAISSYQQALAAFAKAYGENHPQVAVVWSNLACVFGQEGDYRTAIADFEKALSIYEVVLGPSHPTTANTLSDMATILAEMGPEQLEKSRSMLERALATKIESLGSEHPNVAHTESSLGDVLLKLRRYEEALRHAERALAIREGSQGSEHPLVAQSLVLIARIRLERHESSEALKLAERALAILERHPADPSLLAIGRFTLARALWDDRRDRPRARLLGTLAREHAGAEDRSAIDAWIATHR